MHLKNIIKTSTVIIAVIIAATTAQAQNNIGMATGNYAGISSVWLNPANIVDSRYKFDINIIGLNSYYNNNYLLVKNSSIARRLFYKEPYNSSFADVKKDLLEEAPPASGKIYGRTENTVQFPLSFMITTGKKSAIAITMTNRTVNYLDSLNPLTAQLFYGELRNPSLYNTPMNNDNLRYNFLNWQEVGFTYGRVLIGKGSIFLKAAVTAKWLGAGAAGFIQADRLTASFKDSNTLSMNSPLIKYGRTNTADLGAFQRKNIFNNLEDQALGFDAGVVFELRAKINKFKYVDEDADTELRRDENKYLFRLGVSVVDLGEFSFKRKPLTYNHSASFTNWDFSGVKARSFSDFDTAYSKQVNAVSGQNGEFTYRLPASVIVNFDLHLFSGFYINIAAKQPLEGYGSKADTYLASDRWTVVTPRFESKFLGIYVPVSRVNNRTNIGATVKFGPVYFGSNNLAEIISNEKTYQADFHAGVRLSILQGKPSRLLLSSKKLLAQNNDDIYMQKSTEAKIDSLSRETAMLKRKLSDSALRPVINIIVHNDGTQVQSDIQRMSGDSIVINNRSSSQAAGKSSAIKQQDTTYNLLLRQLATQNVEINKLREEVNSPSAKSKSPKTTAANNEEIEKELQRLRVQMAAQTAALIAATAIAAPSNKKDTVFIKPDSLQQSGSDSVSAKTDTVVVRDTISIVQPVPEKEIITIRDTIYTNAASDLSAIPQYPPVYFNSGKSTLSDETIEELKKVAAHLMDHPNHIIELTGRTDASGSAAVNQRVAKARINAIKNILIKEGVAPSKILSAAAIGNSAEKNTASQRRVDLLIIQQ